MTDPDPAADNQRSEARHAAHEPEPEPAEQAPGALPAVAVDVEPSGAVELVKAVPARRADEVIAPRRDARVGPPPRHPQWLINQLPVGMLQSDFFVRFVSIFQELATPLLDDADLVEHLPDHSVAPAPMLSTLARWIGVDAVDASLDEGLQRVLLASSSKALAHRGTVDGLRTYLAMLSGGPAQVQDGGGVWAEGESPADVAWVRMQISSTGHLTEDEFVAIIRDEIPAHVRAELWVGPNRLFSTDQERR